MTGKPWPSLAKSEEFKHGYVEVKDEEVEELLRSLTELRLTLRENFLEKFQMNNSKMEK